MYSKLSCLAKNSKIPFKLSQPFYAKHNKIFLKYPLDCYYKVFATMAAFCWSPLKKYILFDKNLFHFLFYGFYVPLKFYKNSTNQKKKKPNLL